MKSLLPLQRLQDKKLKNKRLPLWPKLEPKRLKGLKLLFKPKFKQLLRNSKRLKQQKLLLSKLKRTESPKNKD